ncbi:hypothetical protein, partial [Xanthomonas graminis]
DVFVGHANVYRSNFRWLFRCANWFELIATHRRYCPAIAACMRCTAYKKAPAGRGFFRGRRRPYWLRRAEAHHHL